MNSRPERHKRHKRDKKFCDRKSQWIINQLFTIQKQTRKRTKEKKLPKRENNFDQNKPIIWEQKR